jgi:hypothetical protein
VDRLHLLLVAGGQQPRAFRNLLQGWLFQHPPLKAQLPVLKVRKRGNLGCASAGRIGCGAAG